MVYFITLGKTHNIFLFGGVYTTPPYYVYGTNTPGLLCILVRGAIIQGVPSHEDPLSYFTRGITPGSRDSA